MSLTPYQRWLRRSSGFLRGLVLMRGVLLRLASRMVARARPLLPLFLADAFQVRTLEVRLVVALAEGGRRVVKPHRALVEHDQRGAQLFCVGENVRREEHCAAFALEP